MLSTNITTATITPRPMSLLAQRGYTERAEVKQMYDPNPKTAIGFNETRRDEEMRKRTVSRLAQLTSSHVNKSDGTRGRDMQTFDDMNMYDTVFAFYVYSPENPACWDRNLRSGKQKINMKHQQIVRPGLPYMKATDVILEAVKVMGYDKSWNTIKKCADRFRDKLTECKGNRLLALGDMTSSNRDGREPTNAKYTDPNCQTWMKEANDNINGGGSWMDLSVEYNSICQANNRRDLEGCNISLWRWAGHFGWSGHRRWIKPLLLNVHMVRKNMLIKGEHPTYIVLDIQLNFSLFFPHLTFFQIDETS